jgi:hypothetical protein
VLRAIRTAGELPNLPLEGRYLPLEGRYLPGLERSLRDCNDLGAVRIAVFTLGLLAIVGAAAAATPLRGGSDPERIVFSAGSDYYSLSIYTIRSDGSGLRRLT